MGPGVVQTVPTAASMPASVTAIRAGLIGFEAIESLKDGRCVSRWIESRIKRYVPAHGEPVIGVIIARHAEGYRVDIGSAHMATLDALAFEGATKRSKPNLKIGALIYARVSFAQNFAEPEVECFDSATQKAQGFGELSGGMLIRSLELSTCRSLLQPNHSLLPALGKRFPFECAVGLNGRAWVKATDCDHTIELAEALKNL